tara:strand:+ start:712 stop:1866 length:1155 start_codon:yes stop_codon:yes gene_type:complete
MTKDDDLRSGEKDAYGDVSNIDQAFNEGNIREKYDAWQERWNEGTKFGIVGGSGLKASITPDTVLEQVQHHGQSDVSRTGSAFTGLGDLVDAIEEILDNDIITTHDVAEIEKQYKLMKQVLSDPKKNPQNIPFHTVVEFHENKDDPKKPNIVRGMARGHYRTEAYNDYVAWAQTHKKNFKGKPAKTDNSWYEVGKDGGDAPEGKAKPPLYLAIADKRQGIMGITQIIKRNLKGTKIVGDGTTFRVRRNAGNLHLIPSVADFIKNEVINDPSIYPKGKQRAPVKQRLNDKFEGKVFTVAGSGDIDNLNKLIIGAGGVLGMDSLTTFQLSFPKNNIALNNLIENVMGDEMDTFQKPGTVSDKKADNYAPAGIVLKTWQGMLKRGMI